MPAARIALAATSSNTYAILPHCVPTDNSLSFIREYGPGGKDLAMHRRGFILSACAAMHLMGASHALSQVTAPNGSAAAKPADLAENGNVFQELADLIKELSNNLAAITDAAAKRKFADSLTTLGENLAQIIRAKRDILYALEHEPCAASGENDFMRSAGWQASQVSAFVIVLSEQVRNITVAVRSPTVREQANGVAGKLLSREANRYWAGDLHTYCQLAPDQQAAFLQEVRESGAAIETAGEELNKLIASLAK
jgi:hypothetical protein